MGEFSIGAVWFLFYGVTAFLVFSILHFSCKVYTFWSYWIHTSILKLENYLISHQTYSDNSPHGNAVVLLGTLSGWSISGIYEVCHAISSLNTLTTFQVFIFTEILPENFLWPRVSVQLLRKAPISNGNLDKPFSWKAKMLNFMAE